MGEQPGGQGRTGRQGGVDDTSTAPAQPQVAQPQPGSQHTEPGGGWEDEGGPVGRAPGAELATVHRACLPAPQALEGASYQHFTSRT